MAKSKKRAKKKTKKKAEFKLHGLHEKKLAIMAEIPVMPCTVISSDRAGSMFAHTKASQVFATYSEACRKHRLVIHMIDIRMEMLDVGQHKASRATCKFMIRDMDSQECDYFWGSGLGDNYVWSDSSAQTVAFKQALLMYFFTSWPQPEEFVSVAKDYMKELPTERFVDVVKEITPLKAKTDAETMKEMREFFGVEE